MEHMNYDANDLRAIESSGTFRSDAGESIWFARQLDYVKGQAYDVKRPPLAAMQLFPIANDIPEGALTVTYRQYDSVGAAKLIASYSDDLPRSDVKAREFTSPIRGIGISYGYNTREIRHARMAGVPLDTKKMMAARLGHDETINRLAWFGDADAGIPGFLTNPNIPGYAVPADGAGGGGSSKLWVNKTADQVIRDMNGIVNQVYTQSKTVHRANELWVPPSQYAYISSTPRSATSDTTILEFFLRSNPFVQRVVPVLELQGALSGPLDTMVAIDNNVENYQMVVPMMFRQYSPQERNLEWVIPCESETGGVIFTYPFAAALADSI